MFFLDLFQDEIPHGLQAKNPEALVRISLLKSEEHSLINFQFCTLLSVIVLDSMLVISHWLMIVTILHDP